MSRIKTRETVKSIKSLDKAAIASERMRQTAIRAKQKTSALMDNTSNSSNEYAQDKLQYGMEDMSREAAHGVAKGAKSTVQRGKEYAQKQRKKKRQANEQAQTSVTGETAANTDTANPQPTKKPDVRSQRAETVSGSQSRGKKYAMDSAKKRSAQSQQTQVAHATQDAPQGRIRMPDKTIKQSRRSSGSSTIKALPNIEQTRGQSPKPYGLKTQSSRTEIHDTGQSRTRQPITELPRNGRSVTAPHEIKTAQQTSKVSIKTADATAKAASKTAKESQKTVQRVRAASKKAEETAKKAADAIAASVKAIIQGVKTLVAAIASGGTVAILAVVIIMLIALLVGSCFGIFFSSEEKNDGSERMFHVVREINTEFDNRIDTIKNSVNYDELVLSGSHAQWQDILAIYAVKTTNDTDDPMEVASVSDVKKGKLRDVFWDMTEIDSRTESVTTGEGDDAVTTVYLYITVTSKTADVMASEYGFSDEQLEQLHELMETQYRPLWMSVIYGIKLGGSGGSDDIVAVALSQIGNVGGEPYWSWYGFSSRVEWCACFVSWCANECGYIESGAVPLYAYCPFGVDWFKSHGQWMDGSETPEPGMIVFFDWNERGSSGPQDGSADHTGIVERVEDGIVYTVEGNSGDGCRERQYTVGNREILGYGLIVQ